MKLDRFSMPLATLVCDSQYVRRFEPVNVVRKDRFWMCRFRVRDIQSLMPCQVIPGYHTVVGLASSLPRSNRSTC